jgi:hypothetical protein
MPTYALVLRLDRRIREFYVPPEFRAVNYSTPEECAAVDPSTVIKRYGTSSLKEHRTYFLRQISSVT